MGGEIGVKLADGSFYSVLEEDFTGRKKLVVTTSRDNQDSVQIDLYRGSLEGAEAFIGSLMIENIQPAPKREPEIELQLGLDSQREPGGLRFRSDDRREAEPVGEPACSRGYRAPGGPGPGRGNPGPPGLRSPSAGKAWPASPTRSGRRTGARRPWSPAGRGVLAVIGFVLLGLLVLAGAAYLV